MTLKNDFCHCVCLIEVTSGKGVIRGGRGAGGGGREGGGEGGGGPAGGDLLETSAAGCYREERLDGRRMEERNTSGD